MSTITISLPEKQRLELDRLTKRFGFANRSEFFRALMRYITQKPEIINEASTFPFTGPPKSNNKIVKAFKDSSKYSPDFIKDLKEGLDNSDFFVD